MQFAIDGSFQTKALAKAGLDRVPWLLSSLAASRLY